MGYYINPANETKESFLGKHGVRITKEMAKTHDDFEKDILVVHVDNGPFTAAGICHDARERDDWLGDETDPRPMKCFLVAKEFLVPFMVKK